MLKSVQEVARDIEAGKRLVLAGDEDLLARLPKGTWSGGTIPYSMDEKGGKISRDQIFVHDVTALTCEASIRFYAVEDLQKIPVEAPENSQGNGGTLRFEEEGFSVKTCLVNGRRRKYLTRERIDTRLSLVADYVGAMVNVSFQAVREADGPVTFGEIAYQLLNQTLVYLEIQ